MTPSKSLARLRGVIVLNGECEWCVLTTDHVHNIKDDDTPGNMVWVIDYKQLRTKKI